MPYRGELGFPGAALVLFFFFPAFALVVRRKWRLAAARREEVMRLVLLASEESLRAEIESTLVYGSDSSSVSGGEIVKPQCAVCYSPTTTRCSRCKAVRYCSGKCQIIHWRQGHKEDCHPPHTDTQHNSAGSVSVPKAVQAEKSNIYENTLEPTKTLLERPASADSCGSCTNFSREDDVESKHPVDTSVTESTSDSSTISSSSSFSTFTAPVETLDDVSVSEDPALISHASSAEPLSSDVAHDCPNTTPDVCEINLTKSPPSKIASVNLSVNSSSCSGESTHKVCGSSTEDAECGSGGSFGSSFIYSDDCTIAKPSIDLSECQNTTFDSGVAGSADHVDSSDSKLGQTDVGIRSNSRSSFQFSFKLPGRASVNEMPSPAAVPSEDMGMPNARDSPALGFDELPSVARGRSNDECLPKSGRLSSLSSVAFGDPTSSSSEGHSVSTVKSLNVSSAPTIPTRVPETIYSASSGSYDLKTSMRRVVQQFRSSKLSGHYPSGFGSESGGKYNYKMLFPYDLFIKLYNCEKVELRPCGLTNCGNSCYANSVLQCLTFTPPLTAYFLQGLHTKTCPKKEWCFTCEFESLVLKAKQGKSPLSPITILSQIHNIGSHLGHGKEEDAHEFLRYAIDAMQSSCLKEAGANAVGPFAEETTFIQLMFGGYLRSKIKCLRCHGKSERRERMMDLTVEIDGDIGTLEDALTRFTATEILDGENKYQCNRCKSYERAKKKLTILEAPNILTVTLKRFQSGKFGKLNKVVQFPEILNLAPYMSRSSDKSPVYGLYAVVVHLDIMNAAFSGHYVCYVKNTTGKWYKVDDSTVKPVELNSVLSKGAYMLLYARCSPRAPNLIRNAMIRDFGKNKWTRCVESVPSSHREDTTINKSRSNHTTSHSASSVARPGTEDSPNWTKTGRSNFDPVDGRFLYRVPSMDSSSDSSSLFSCSDEGSCSTESTRDSTSTDDYSEYIFRDSGHFSWNSPLRFSEDSDGFTCSPLTSRRSPEAVSSGHMSDSPRSRYSTSDFSCLSQEDACRMRGVNYEEDPAEADRFGTWQPQESREVFLQGRESPSFLHSNTTKQCRKLTEQGSSRETDWVNPLEVKSNVSIRSSTRNRTTQTFY